MEHTVLSSPESAGTRSPASASGTGGAGRGVGGGGAGAGVGAGVGREGRPLNRRMRLKAANVGSPLAAGSVGVTLASPTAATQGAAWQ